MPSRKANSASGEAKQCTAVLSPTPRGSQLAMSKRARNASVIAPATGSTCVPAAPGPPKLKNSVPIRCLWSVA